MTSPQPRWGAVTVDCLDPELMAEFWSALLGKVIGGRWGDQYVHLRPSPGAPALAFQRVATKAPGKNALHLDVHVADESEVEPLIERAKALGAQEMSRMQQDDVEWVILLDPEQNQFCVIAFEEPSE